MKFVTRPVQIVVALCVAAAILAAAASGALAATPTPTPTRTGTRTPTPLPTETATPTATPAPGTYIPIEVIDDLNGDGLRQLDEPGIAGASLHSECGDALMPLPSTDALGRSILLISPYNGRVRNCITLEPQFGWLTTTPSRLEFDFPAGQSYAATFLVHFLGPDVMQVAGEVFVEGLPAPYAPITLAEPFAGCIERPAGLGYRYPLFFVVGAARPGCPAPGDTVRVLLDGSPAGDIVYARGLTEQRDLVARGDSMRVYGDFSAARIGSKDCGVFERGGSLVSVGRMFVLSDEARPGCGAPGRLVRLYRGGVPLDPVVEWRAGDFVYPDDLLDFVPAHGIVAPDTGMGPPDATAPSALLLAMSVVLGAGTISALAGLLLRRRTIRSM